ncbi:MAG: hypothetical protein OEY13_06405 [Gammaproteobacteria bacterium]|nr:hypothetical protein [Gammaproteobacteria bacterium]
MPASASPAESRSERTTIAERSGLTRTGRDHEVERLCAAFAARWHGKARCFEFGRSPENRPLLAVAVSDDGVLPEFVRADDPASGLAAEVRSPRYSLSYWATRNRFGGLVETHSWQEYP